jgi:hypothetical protein
MKLKDAICYVREHAFPELIITFIVWLRNEIDEEFDNSRESKPRGSNSKSRRLPPQIGLSVALQADTVDLLSYIADKDEYYVFELGE